MSEGWVEVPVLRVQQPIGDFYLGVASWQDLVSICRADVRHWEEAPERSPDNGTENIGHYIGIQRPLSSKRVREIQQYVRNVDACFPSTIIIAVPSENVGPNGVSSTLKIKRSRDSATIIDGQHRLAGFVTDLNLTFELPVAIFIDLELEEKARLFSTINVEQTKINPSLARDLVEFSSIDIPEKIVHNIAKAMHSDPGGPWFGRIKMLGRKEDVVDGISTIITQHAFVSELLELIYPETPELQRKIRNMLITQRNERSSLIDQSIVVDKTRYPFWEFYVEGREDVMRKVLDNYFRAIQATFPNEWANQELILSKTVGYGAFMRELRTFIPRGRQEGNLSIDFFRHDLDAARRNLGDLPLTVDYWGSSEASINKLRRTLFPETQTTQIATV